MGKAAFFLFWALLFGWSGQKLAVYGLGLYQQGKASADWVAVEATVDSFKVKSTSRNGARRGGGSTSYAKVLYTYEYGGETYTGDRTGFGSYHISKVKRPRRGKAEVYVDPEEPSESVYIKGVSKANLGGVAVAIGLVLAGLGFAFLTIRSLIER